MLLALAANTSFGGLPVLMALLARDNHLPHVFGLKADRQVHRHGVLALAAASAALLIVSGGDTNTLVPLFAIGVFVGFTLCRTGMVRHWCRNRTPGWQGKAALNGCGALLTGVAAVVVTATKFTEGAWLIVIACRCSSSLSSVCTARTSGSAVCSASGASPTPRAEVAPSSSSPSPAVPADA